MDIGSFNISVHALLLKNDQYRLLVKCRKAMYGDRASEVSLASVIALLAREELAQSDEYSEPYTNDDADFGDEKQLR